MTITPHAPSRRQLLSASVALAASSVARGLHAQVVSDETGRTARAALARLEQWSLSRKVSLGASVIELATLRELAASSSQVPLNPASTQKILTIAAALDRLGPAHRFTTSLHGTQTADSLDRLVLRGDGDPELTSADLSVLVDRLLALGVRRVRGDVLVDQGAFDASWEPPAYAQRPNDWAAYRAPVSAVAVDGNTVTLHVRATQPGAPTRAWLEPFGVGRIQGTITTLPSDGREYVGLTIVPATSPVVARVSGGMPITRGALSYARRLPSPELVPGHVVRARLERAGIAIDGRTMAGSATGQPELARVSSRPLVQLVHALGKQSNNFVAEMLLKALGRASGAAVGSSSAGAAAIESFLRARAALTPGTRLLNGSGLYDANRVSAYSLARVLSLAERDPRLGPELVASLAIGGVDGTLINRFPAERTTRSVRAKTGTLANVITLAGYAFGPTPVAFAFLLNGLNNNQTEARRELDLAASALLGRRAH